MKKILFGFFVGIAILFGYSAFAKSDFFELFREYLLFKKEITDTQPEDIQPEKEFGGTSSSNFEYSTGTPTYLSTYLINGFTSTTTVSFSGGDSLRVNIWGKPGTVTSTVGIMLQTSNNGTNFFTLATSTIDKIYKSYSYPSYSFLPGDLNNTTTISFLIPKDIIGNADFVRTSFNTTNLSDDPNDGVNVYIELWKETQF